MSALCKVLLPAILMAGLLAGCVYEGPGYRPSYGYYYQPHGYAPSYSFGFSYYGGGNGHHRWYR